MKQVRITVMLVDKPTRVRTHPERSVKSIAPFGVAESSAHLTMKIKKEPM